MSQSLTISAASIRLVVDIQLGVRPSSCRTSLELSNSSFESLSFSTKCTVLLVLLSSICFKVMLRGRRPMIVSTGRVFHSSFVIFEASFTPCPGRDPDCYCLFPFLPYRSLSSVRDQLFSPDAILDFKRLHGRSRRCRFIISTCCGGFLIEDGTAGCPIQPHRSNPRP